MDGRRSKQCALPNLVANVLQQMKLVMQDYGGKTQPYNGIKKISLAVHKNVTHFVKAWVSAK